MYQAGGGNIGTLLRLIQEEQANNMAAIPPSADVASPIRAAIQQPLKSPESVGTSRIVSGKPEAVTPIETTPQVVAPTEPVMPTPVSPSAPSIASPSAPSAPSVSNSNPSPASSAPRATPVSTPSPAPQAKGVTVSGGTVRGTSTSKPVYAPASIYSTKITSTPVSRPNAVPVGTQTRPSVNINRPSQPISPKDIRPTITPTLENIKGILHKIFWA